MSDSRIHIVATLSPKSGTPEMADALVAGGMNVMRLNMSWGTHEEDVEIIKNVREAAQAHNTHVPVIIDLSGPRLQEADGHRFNEEETVVITDKDKKDIVFAIQQQAEYIALSYIGTATDVYDLRTLIAAGGGTQKIIAKIERQEAVNEFDDIVVASDVIMIARGDLGLAMPPEQIPFVQTDLTNRANRAGKPVIVATEMLASMIQSATPTRADVTDVAYAAITGADAVMLSNETATGNHPVEAVSMMERILKEAERQGYGAHVCTL